MAWVLVLVTWVLVLVLAVVVVLVLCIKCKSDFTVQFSNRKSGDISHSCNYVQLVDVMSGGRVLVANELRLIAVGLYALLNVRVLGTKY